MEQQKFGTDDRHEFIVNDFIGHVKEWNKLLQPKGAKVLIIDEMPLALEYARENEVVYVSTRKSNVEFVKQHFNNIKALNIRLDKLKIIAKILEVRNMVTFDFIVGNPPYCGDLFLNISQQLQPYLTKDGKMFILAPSQCIENPGKMHYQTVYQQLFQHLETLNLVPDEMKRQFDSFNGFTNLGIYGFVKNKVNRDVNSMWEYLNNEQVVEITKKIKASRLPMVSDVLVKNTANGIIVPIGSIGGDTKKFISYATFKYCKDGICSTLIKGKHGMLYENKIPISKQKEGVQDNKIIRGIPCGTEESAIRTWKLYRHNKLMTGLCVISRFGSGNNNLKQIPFFSNENHEITNKEIIEALNLNEDNVKYLKKIAE